MSPSLMFRGFFSFLQLKNRQFKGSRGETIALSTLWCWSHSIAWGLGWKCAWLFLVRLISDKASEVKATSVAPLQRQSNLLAEWLRIVSKHLRVCACVCRIPLFLNSSFRLPQALGDETWLYFFLGRVRPCPCWISVIDLFPTACGYAVQTGEYIKTSTGLNTVSDMWMEHNVNRQ